MVFSQNAFAIGSVFWSFNPVIMSEKRIKAPLGAPLIVLSGPSGVGKNTIIGRLRTLLGGEEATYFNVSWTTRLPRGEEIDGVDYHFKTIEEFETAIRAGQLLEFAKVHGNYYGSPVNPLVNMVILRDKIGILDIDCEGAERLRQHLHVVDRPQNQNARVALRVFDVFVEAPIKTIEDRLWKRATDTHEQIQRRLQNARAELERSGEFSLVVDNSTDDGGEAAARAIFGRFQMYRPTDSVVAV